MPLPRPVLVALSAAVLLVAGAVDPSAAGPAPVQPAVAVTTAATAPEQAAAQTAPTQAAPQQAARKVATRRKARPAKAAPAKAAPKKVAVRATTTSRAAGCDGTSGWRERRAAAAVTAVGLAPEDLGYRLVVRPAKRGLLGLADSGPRTVTLYVRDCRALSPAGLAFVLAHELAHALDFSCADPARRDAWLAARGSRAPYWPTAGARDDLGSGAGDFAEAFAVARTGHRAMWASRVGKAPTAAQLSAWKHLLRPSC